MSQRRVQERTVRRKAALLDAAVDLMTEAGFAAVTLRAVAARAGVPLAATTYHFAARDDLVVQAFARLVDRELDHLTTVLGRFLDDRFRGPREGIGPGEGTGPRNDSGPRDSPRLGDGIGPSGGGLETVAGRLARAYTGDRGRQLGVWELYLQAGRDPGLQHVARAWTDGCDAILAQVLRQAGLPSGEEQVRFVSAVLCGLWLE